MRTLGMNKSGRKVIVLTPSHNGDVAGEYSDSFSDSRLAAAQMGIVVTAMRISGNSLIDDARCQLLAKALETDATDFFFIDADGGWDLNTFLCLAQSEKDVVAGVWPKKLDKEDYPLAINTDYSGKPITDLKDGMISTALVGAAFMRIRRGVIEAMQRYYPDLWYNDPEYGKVWKFFYRMENGHNKPWGEDYTFCKLWTAIGGKIWLLPDANFTHVGVRRWKGNYHDFLRRQPGGDLYKGREHDYPMNGDLPFSAPNTHNFDRVVIEDLLRGIPSGGSLNEAPNVLLGERPNEYVVPKGYGLRIEGWDGK